MKPIVPAIIPQSEAAVVAATHALSFSPELHLDVVDGQFVKTVSWPYEPAGDLQSIKPYTDAFTLEVDLMVKQPLGVAPSWLAAGADMLVFHIETVTAEALSAFAESTRVSIGVSLHGATPLAQLEPYLVFADYVQLMGIYEIGAQGLPFDERVIEKIATLKRARPSLTVSVDGSVNASTIRRLHEAGVDRFICGSAIVGQSNPAVAYATLQGLING